MKQAMAHTRNRSRTLLHRSPRHRSTCNSPSPRRSPRLMPSSSFSAPSSRSCYSTLTHPSSFSSPSARALFIYSTSPPSHSPLCCTILRPPSVCESRLDQHTHNRAKCLTHPFLSLTERSHRLHLQREMMRTESAWTCACSDCYDVDRGSHSMVARILKHKQRDEC